MKTLALFSFLLIGVCLCLAAKPSLKAQPLAQTKQPSTQVTPPDKVIQSPASLSPLEQQIHDLESQLRSTSIAQAGIPNSQSNQPIKEQLNRLYSQRSINRTPHNPLDQAGDNCSQVGLITNVPYTDSGTTTGRANTPSVSTASRPAAANALPNRRRR